MLIFASQNGRPTFTRHQIFTNMKIKTLATALALATLTVAGAQPNGGRGGDPVQRAERQSQMMIDSLSLSTKQGEKVKEINLKYAHQQQQLRSANTDGNWETMRPKMDSLRTAQNGELKAVLTSDQYARWQKIAEQQWQRRGGPGTGVGTGGGRGERTMQAPPPPPTPTPPSAPEKGSLTPPPAPEKSGGG
jgi:Spy/CpxP family protein refolding chaperone